MVWFGFFSLDVLFTVGRYVVSFLLAFASFFTLLFHGSSRRGQNKEVVLSCCISFFVHYGGGASLSFEIFFGVSFPLSNLTPSGHTFWPEV